MLLERKESARFRPSADQHRQRDHRRGRSWTIADSSVGAAPQRRGQCRWRREEASGPEAETGSRSADAVAGMKGGSAAPSPLQLGPPWNLSLSSLDSAPLFHETNLSSGED